MPGESASARHIEQPAQKPKHTFDRLIRENPSAEEVVLPQAIEQEFIKNQSDKPLGKITAAFKEAGIPEAEIERYQAAVSAFADRPAEVSKGQIFYFYPQQYYFGTDIGLKTELQPLPDLLKNTPLKPRLGKGPDQRSIVTHPFDGQKILEAFENLESSPDKVTPMEKLLVQINRGMYRLHEPLHITQDLTTGDRLNRLKDRYQAHTIFNSTKEKEIIEYEGYQTPDTWHKPEWMNGSKFILPKPDIPDHDDYWAGVQVANNETTMDILSEEATRDLIREQPVFLLWLHNTLSAQMEALRTYRQNLLDTLSGKDGVYVPKPEAFEQLEMSTGMIMNAYFAAFENSEAVETFLQKADNKTLNRKVRGQIAHVPSFTETDFLNHLNDIRQLIELLKKQEDGESIDPDLLTEHQFPSGKRYLKKTKSQGAITQEGVRRAALIVKQAIDQGFTSEDIQERFASIQNGVNLDDAARLAAIKAAMHRDLKIDLSVDAIKEMHNVDKYMYFDNFDDYKLKLAARREIFREVRAVAPQETRNLIKGLFYEIPLSMKIGGIEIMTGFGKIGETNEWQARPWEEIEQDLALGIVDLNVPLLPDDDKNELKNLWQRGPADCRKSEYQEEVLEKMTKMAKRQRTK